MTTALRRFEQQTWDCEDDVYFDAWRFAEKHHLGYDEDYMEFSFEQDFVTFRRYVIECDGEKYTIRRTA